jgi:hypothetical protein
VPVICGVRSVQRNVDILWVLHGSSFSEYLLFPFVVVSPTLFSCWPMKLWPSRLPPPSPPPQVSYFLFDFFPVSFARVCLAGVLAMLQAMFIFRLAGDRGVAEGRSSARWIGNFRVTTRITLIFSNFPLLVPQPSGWLTCVQYCRFAISLNKVQRMKGAWSMRWKKLGKIFFPFMCLGVSCETRRPL